MIELKKLLHVTLWTVLGAALLHPADATSLLPVGGNRTLAYEFKIEYATYFGGSEWEEAREVIPLADRSVLIGGQTASDDLTVTPGAVQPRYAGEPAGTGHGGLYSGDMFLARFSPDGSRIVAATYFGGSKQERNVYGMALDRQGNIVFSTATRSTDLPTTPAAYQRNYGGGPADMMAAKISPDMKRLLWCTYVGSTGTDWGRGGLAVDARDHVYLVGRTNSADFPTTSGVYQPNQKGTGDAVLVKLAPDASRLVFSTRLGGSKEEVIIGARVDAAGNAHLAGHTWSHDFPVTPGAPQPDFGGGQVDAFMAGISADGSRLLYATYLGGSGNEFAEHRLGLLADGSVLFSGFVGSSDFPTTPGAFQRNLRGPGDGFLTKLAADHRRLAFSTLLGGSAASEFYLMPAADDRGSVFIVGQTASRDFPVTHDALQKTYGGGQSDGVLAVLSPDGTELLYATYLGGSGDDLIRGLSLGPRGKVYLVGKTSSRDLPVTPAAAQPAPGGKMDAFLVKLTPIPEPATLSLNASGTAVVGRLLRPPPR